MPWLLVIGLSCGAAERPGRPRWSRSVPRAQRRHPLPCRRRDRYDPSIPVHVLCCSTADRPRVGGLVSVDTPVEPPVANRSVLVRTISGHHTTGRCEAARRSQLHRSAQAVAQGDAAGGGGPWSSHATDLEAGPRQGRRTGWSSSSWRSSAAQGRPHHRRWIRELGSASLAQRAKAATNGRSLAPAPASALVAPGPAVHGRP